MKHRFLYVSTMIAMLLCATSEMQGMGVAAKSVFASADNLATKGFTSLTKLTKEFGSDVVGLARRKGLPLTNDVLGSLKSLKDNFAKAGYQSADDAFSAVGKNIDAAKKIGVDFKKATSDDLVKIGSKDVSTMSDDVFKDTFPHLQRNQIKAAQQGQKQGAAILSGTGQKAAKEATEVVTKKADDVVEGVVKKADDVVDDVAEAAGEKAPKRTGYTLGLYKKLKNKMGKFDDDAIKKAADNPSNPKLQEAAKKAQAAKEIIENPNASASARKHAVRDLADAEYKMATMGGKALRVVSSAFNSRVGLGVLGLSAALWMAIVMMVPQFMQSTFIAQQQQMALFQTYVPPTQFGKIVMQLPDSAVDMTNPAASQFIYYGIPVSNPGDKLSPQAKAAYPGVSDPTTKNKVSQGVHNYLAQTFSGSMTKEVKIPRYNLDAQALTSLPVFVSYTDQSWSEWAANAIPDPLFLQSMINLNTGYIFYADGSSEGVPAANIVGTGVGKTVKTFLAKKYGQLKNVGSVALFREFHDTFSTSKANKVATSLADQFDCSCLDGELLTTEVIQKCSDSKKKSCLLTSALNQIAAGVVLNSQGQVIRPDQDLATEIANGGLGQIIPIQGYGDKLDDILRLFPGAEKQALANSGALTISLGSNVAQATADIQGAPADNYAAKGIHIYQCKNTPLAKMLRSQAGGAVAASDYITDFIVFFDQDLTQVPLLAPMQDPKNYNFIKMDLNPAIKYFSTIIGTLDANGGFSFLPQLNIQSPAALTAKGLPATFAPLYGLQAANGSLAVNYNQNLSTAVGGIVQTLVGNAKLGQQFRTIQNGLLNILTAGPFGQYQLTPVAEEIQPIIGGVQLKMYTGFNSYPVSQDGENANCTDVLIPLSAAGKTISLPSSNVTQYYGLVTDLTYLVRADGTITVDADGFANSPLSQSLALDEKKAEEFYWIDKLTAMGQSNDPEFAMSEDLVNLVVQSRAAWIDWIAQNTANESMSKEFAGITVAGTSMKMTIASQQALLNGMYIYTATPCPSSQAPDYFVLVNSANPQANDAKLGTMSASQATAATNMLSIVSGLLYNVGSGQLVKNPAGAGYSVNAVDVLKGLNSKNPKAFSDNFKAKLNISNGQAAIAAQALVYPLSFGRLQLGIYQADLDAGVYLYVDAAGASVNFVPTDYFVTIDSPKNPTKIGTKLTAQTQYCVSLVSGNVYGPNGVESVMDAASIAKVVGSVASSWRSGVAKAIATSTANYIAKKQDQQKETDEMDAMPAANSGAITLDQASVQKTIAALANQEYLPIPYEMLKHDAASGAYVVVAPANGEETEFIYTFFDVANSFVADKGGPVKVGAIYDGKGNLLHIIRDLELVLLLRQYGVVIDAAGRQSLGVQNSSPAMPLDPADKSLKPGVSGKSMIYSNDAQFASFGIVSPVSYDDSKFYIYFNLITQNYYAMKVTGSEVVYVDMVGGKVYNLDGSPRVEMNPVAINANGDATDMLLSYANQNGFMSCIMKNSANNNSYSDFLNLQDNFEVTNDPATQNSCGLNSLISIDDAASQIQVAQMPFAQDAISLPKISAMQQYNVYVKGLDKPLSYTVSPMYAWQNLQLLPINIADGSLLKAMPDDSYHFVQLVMKNNAPHACVFAGKLYGNAQSSGKDVYTMTSGADKLIMSIKKDAKADTNYVEIVAGPLTYSYQYMLMNLADDQLEDYRRNGWKADVVIDSTGQVVLEKILSSDASENLQLSPVSMKSVVNAPSDAAKKAALQVSLGSVLQDRATERFVVAVSNGTYSYFTQDGYVDLENGILFDAQGVTVGYPLQFTDLMDILNQLSVSVVRNQSKQAGLRYRPISEQQAQVILQSLDEDTLLNLGMLEDQENARLLGTMTSKKNKKSSKTKAKTKVKTKKSRKN